MIAEALITAERRRQHVITLGSLEVVLVGVRCDIAVARQGEDQRGDRLRPAALPAETFEAVHAALSYDIEVDTSVAPAGEITARLVEEIEAVSPTAFEVLRSSA